MVDRQDVVVKNELTMLRLLIQQQRTNAEGSTYTYSRVLHLIHSTGLCANV